MNQDFLQLCHEVSETFGYYGFRLERNYELARGWRASILERPRGKAPRGVIMVESLSAEAAVRELKEKIKMYVTGEHDVFRSEEAVRPDSEKSDLGQDGHAEENGGVQQIE